MKVSTLGRKHTGREASPSATPSSASSSAVSFEEISPMPQMARSACTRKSKYKPVVREPSRVDKKSQKAVKIAITKKKQLSLTVGSNSCDGGVAAREHETEYCKKCGGYYYDTNHKYFSND
jgi:hypothetical protein